jgi:hypothetical protein
MAEHHEEMRIATPGGGVWIVCSCGWLSPPLHGAAITELVWGEHCGSESPMAAAPGAR